MSVQIKRRSQRRGLDLVVADGLMWTRWVAAWQTTRVRREFIYRIGQHLAGEIDFGRLTADFGTLSS